MDETVLKTSSLNISKGSGTVRSDKTEYHKIQLCFTEIRFIFKILIVNVNSSLRFAGQ